MDVMNEGQHLTYLQKGIEFQLGKEKSLQIHKSLCELQRSLMSYFVNLIDQERKRSQAISSFQEQESETWGSLNWECPGEVEYRHVIGILKQQKDLLQQQANDGKDTSLNNLLVNLTRCLWKYLLFYSARSTLRPNFTCLCYDEEYCQANASQEKDATFKQHVKMLIYYLKASTAGWRTENSTSTRYKDDINLADVLNITLSITLI